MLRTTSDGVGSKIIDRTQDNTSVTMKYGKTHFTQNCDRETRPFAENKNSAIDGCIAFPSPKVSNVAIV
jgi:hypothetical protein